VTRNTKFQLVNSGAFGMAVNLVTMLVLVGWKRGLVAFVASLVIQLCGGVLIAYVFEDKDKSS